MQESWFEKLHEWDKALAAYKRKQDQNKDDDSLTLARMRCLEAMGDWWVKGFIIILIVFLTMA